LYTTVMKTILIVEDDKILADTLKDKISQANYTVLHASDGKEGLKLIAEHPVDLILLDIVMPNMDGVNMAYHLSQAKMMESVPVIILTNLTTFAFPEGVKEVLIKSNTSLNDIISKIRSAIGE
jgi:DNA-binding response OmpR family regulator